jgi:hypothetical protein
MQMYDRVNDMVKLLDVIDKTDSTSFWQDNCTSTFHVVSTMHIIKKVPIVWKGPDWESFLNILLNAKVTPKVVVFLCDRKSFRFFLTTAMKSIFITKMRFEFGQYMVGAGKALVSFPSLMKEPIF